jgi:inorganic triphosphatase YgiF
MEIEAKFGVPDAKTFRRLLESESVGAFQLGRTSAVEVHDHYFDTADGDLRAAGYACRLRQEGDRYVASIKGLGDASGAVHRRSERETELPGPLPPNAWPDGPQRALLMRLSRGRPLVLLFEILQERCRRLARDAGLPVAELSFDRVQVRLEGSIADEYLEVEAELSPSGSQPQLARLASALEERWGLAPQPRSKFERALAIRGALATRSRR